MAKYLLEVKKELEMFDDHRVTHIQREQNMNANALARLATSKDADLLKMVPVEVILIPSIDRDEELMEVDQKPYWNNEYREYLVNDVGRGATHHTLGISNSSPISHQGNSCWK